MYEFYYPDEKPIAVIDGELNPSYFRPLEPPTPEELHKRQIEREKRSERRKIFKAEYKKLYGQVKQLAIIFKNGKVVRLNLKDPEYGWRIRWSVRTLLRQAVLKKRLGFSQYGCSVQKEV